MESELEAIVARIHESGRRVVLAITGGGSNAVAQLLRVPGGSRTLLEAIIPYSLSALAEFLGAEPQHACDPTTATAMAEHAYRRADCLAGDDAPRVGIGVTASLVSDRPKQGKHRCHIAAATDGNAEVVSITLQKAARDRGAEEDLVARATLLVLAHACGVDAPAVTSLLGQGDCVEQQSVAAAGPLEQLLAGAIERISVSPDGAFLRASSRAAGLLAGSFHPAHAGHLELARVASRLLGGPVHFELSVVNVDKPPLSAADVRRRLLGLAWQGTVELTRAATFQEKARLFPGITFVVGLDTAERVVDPRYYAGSKRAMIEALDEISAQGCRFLVAGRADARGCWRTLAELDIPGVYAGLFAEIPAEHFRMDISSTELRERKS